MDNDWSECINIDQHLHIMTIKANIAHLISNTVVNFTVIVGVFYFLGEYAIRFVFLTKDYNNTVRRFPITLEFPFESQQSPIFEFLVNNSFTWNITRIYSICFKWIDLYCGNSYFISVFSFLLMFLCRNIVIMQKYYSELLYRNLIQLN